MPQPRKANLDQIIELANSGMKPAEISRLTGLSKPSVAENLKKLGYARNEKGQYVLKEVPSMKGLKEVEKEYIRNRVNGQSKVSAAMSSGLAKCKSSASKVADRLEKREDINTPIADLLYASGIGRKDRAEKLGELLHHQDANIALKSISEANRMDGVYEQKISVTIQDQAEIQRAFVESLERLKELGLLNVDNIIDCSFDTMSGEIKAIEGCVEESEDEGE